MWWLLLIALPLAAAQCPCNTCTNCNVTTTLAAQCPSNSQTYSQGATNITSCQCVPGYYGVPSTNGCSPCVAGTYSSASGATSSATCALLIPGTYSTALALTAQSQSSSCATGTYSTASGSPSSALCSQCAAGTYTSAVAQTQCTLLAAGTYSSIIGATAQAQATSCAVGTYSTALGAVAISTCATCPVGQYCSTVGTAPLPCTDAPSSNSQYLSTSTTSTGCSWQCNNGYYLDTGSCVSCPANSWCTASVKNQCPLNTVSSPLSSSQSQCLCQAGYFGDGSKSPCSLCNAGSYCQGGNGNISTLCPGNSTSPPGSNLITQCQCIPGYEGSNGTTCTQCPQDTICLSGQLSQCPANSHAPAGSYIIDECVANAGFYQTGFGATPIRCPANSYCTGGQAIAPCTSHAISPAQSVSSDACYCDRGYQGVQNAPCVACTSGTWCWTGILNLCQAHSNSPPLSSYMANCTCNPGYTGADGSTCTACGAGTYKSLQGSSDCITCPVGQTFSTLQAQTSCAQCTVCPPGQWASTLCSSNSDSICSYCPVNHFCYHNALTPCPTPSISMANSSSYLDCYCPPGMYGSVGETATCDPCPEGLYCPATTRIDCQC